MRELPLGWTAAALGKLIGGDGIFSDGDWVESKDQDPNGKNRLLQLADIGDGYFINKSNRFVNDEQFDRLRCIKLEEGDVLIARMPDPLGRACLMPRIGQRCLTVVDVAIARPGRKSVSPRWLMHFINAPEVRETIQQESTGTTRKRIARGRLGELELPVPPLPEQKRIADKLDALLARVEATRTRLDAIPTLLKRFRQSVLAAATSGALTEEWRGGYEAEWETTPLGSLVSAIEAGLNVKCEERPPEAGERGLLKISAVTWGEFDQNESKTLPPNEVVDASKKVQVGDLLISRANTIELVGACVIVKYVTRPVYLPDKVLRLVARDDIKKWLLYVLRSPHGRARIELLASGNQLSMRNLSQVNLRSIEIPLPPLEEQREIIRRVESLFAIADNLQRQYEAAKAKVDKLTSALLAKAFRGKLVPQDPNDEPAEQLLERLRATKSVSTPAKRGRKAKTV